MEARDLSQTVAILPEASDKPFNNQAGVVDMLTKPNEVDMSRDLFELPLEAEHSVLFLLSQDRTRCQSVHEKLEGRTVCLIHDFNSGQKAGAHMSHSHRRQKVVAGDFPD
jgi:hypothetical protein